MNAALRTLLIVAAATGLARPAGAQPPKSLEDNLKVCSACHGANGAAPVQPEFPKLGGQHADYLLHALEAYRSGARKNPIMGPQAQALSQREMEALAAYYAAQKSTLATTPLHRLARDYPY
jgi:cytochrome c553